MTIQQVISTLLQEKQNKLPSRFPCRAIMVKNVEEYCILLSELKKISDIKVVQSADLFPFFDVMPKYDLLKDDSYQDEWVILTGVSEYLRLFSKKEAADRRFASLWSHQSSASSTGRIIIPLWGCEAQWFDTAINLNGDLRQQDFYYDCTDSGASDQAMNLLVLSEMFEQHISQLKSLQGNLMIGLKEWFEYWENPSSDATNFVLLTKRCSSVTATSGIISVHVMRDLLSFIKENMADSAVLSKHTCTDEMQNILFEYSLKGMSLDEAVLSSLNVSVFSGIDIMGKWYTMDKGAKELVELWFRLHSDNTYLCHCFKVSGGIGNVVSTIGHEIFKIRHEKPGWIKEYQNLKSVLAIEPDIQFFEELNSIPEYEIRLSFLTNSTREERIYLLRMVGQWMRKDSEQVKVSEKLKVVYPELFAYLCHSVDGLKTDLTGYMARYKSYKLENTLPEDEDVYFAGVDTGVYDYRYSVLSACLDHDSVILWIDALGVEWLPLLKWAIEEKCDVTVKSSFVAMATLPTETCYNEQWNEMSVPYYKLDKLDKLAHKGVVDEPDYYACIEEQLSFIADVSKQVNALIEQHHRVIITGDHGTSRLAARFFHTRDGVPAPKDSKVCSHGRYCILASELTYSMPHAITVRASNGTCYVVFDNYDHFKQSGFAAGADDENAIYGEVHGGSTPEEMLVPVLVLDSKKEMPLTGSWNKSTVKISMKKAKLVIHFNKPISRLTVDASGVTASTSPINDGSAWSAILEGIKPGIYRAAVVADGHVIALPEVTIQSALSGGDGDLP